MPVLLPANFLKNVSHADRIITPSAGIAPALPITSNAIAATKNSIVSLAVMLRNPTINPSTNNIRRIYQPEISGQ